MKKVLFFLLVSMFSPGLLFAQKSLVKLSGGYGMLQSPDLSEFEEVAEALGTSLSKGGGSFGLQYLYGDNRLKYGGEIARLEAYSFSYSNPGAGIDVSASGSVMPMLAIVNYDLSENKSFIPYVQAGLGMATSTFEVKMPGQSSSESKSNVAFMLGAGGAIGIGESTIFDLSLKYHSTSYSYEGENGNETETISLLNIGLGFGYKF
ncbi:MAG: hypothetical protein A3J83_03370 [Elusimicrobia bacterium RIFOXYA2_FULL_40_6]|nr:MAG: hypothetical protein A3J83_03370 [Elusimicrobia bacterium RIFOXYA2_FULL_40_6]